MQQNPENQGQPVGNYALLRSFKPLLELLRDKIGATEVIRVQSSPEKLRLESQQSPSALSFRSGQRHPLSRLMRQNKRASSAPLESRRMPRGSMESMTSIASHMTEYSFVKGTASGASAQIFKSYQDGGFQSVAVKRINGTKFDGHEEELKQLLDRERMALIEMDGSPYVTKFYDYVEYAPRKEYWMVMEFCDAGSAIELLRENLPLNQISAIVAGVIRALEFIHSKGYIHGDIKCANILLTSPGVVKVCDFGLASKVVGVENPDFHALGTVDYMAPEVMLKSLYIDNDDPRADEVEYDRKIDIWAVGIVALELLIGHPPMHHYRHYEEEEFSVYIAQLPEDNKRQSAFFDLFFYSEQIHQAVAENSTRRKRRVPEKDIDVLVKRFPELNPVVNDKKLQTLFHRMSRFSKKPKPNQLFDFNPAEIVGIGNVNKMFSMNKCLSFVAHCLMISKEMRPDAHEISGHTFIRNQYKEWVQLEPHIEEIQEKNKSRELRKHLWTDYSCGRTLREINKIIKAKNERLKQQVRGKSQSLLNM